MLSVNLMFGYCCQSGIHFAWSKFCHKFTVQINQNTDLLQCVDTWFRQTYFAIISLLHSKYIHILVNCNKELVMINNIVIPFNYRCVFGKRNYRVLVRVSVCVCVCVCVCFCTITQKEIDLGTRNRNTL